MALAIHGFLVFIGYKPIALRARPQTPALCPGGQIFIR